MTDLELLKDDAARAELTVTRAMLAFEVTVAALQDAVRKLQADTDAGEKEVMTDLKAMNTAFLLAMKTEAAARETAAKQIGATYGGAALDLEGAREEIRLRLACLRAAGND